MSEVRQVERKNTFEWKISDFGVKKISPNYRLNGLLCSFLALPFSSAESGSKWWGFWIHSSHNSLYPLHYTMSVVDRKGQDSLTRKGTVEGELSNQRILQFIIESDLIKKMDIQTGSLTLRFTLVRVLQEQQSLATGVPTYAESVMNASGFRFGPMIKTCQFCKGIQHPDILKRHEEECQNRFIMCGCGLEVKLKYFEIHAKNCYDENFSKKASSSNVLDCATQTEKPPAPLATKDTSTSTGKHTSASTDEEPSSLLETLSNDFGTFYENKVDTDCVLKVADAQFLVHRAVLSARSPVFSAMFHHDTSENRSGEVNIPDVEGITLTDVLYYIYSGKIRGLTADTAAAMYTVADKYSLIEFRKECLDFLKCNLTMENICSSALLAHIHGETDLEDTVVHFIDDRLEELGASEKWGHFTNTRPLLASKLLYSALMASKKGQLKK